jgi:hypothetical protein
VLTFRGDKDILDDAHTELKVRELRSFRLDPSAKSHVVTLVICWAAFTAMCFLIGSHIWMESIRDQDWFKAPDPNPGHWTRSRVATLFIGSVIGATIGFIHVMVRRHLKGRLTDRGH